MSQARILVVDDQLYFRVFLEDLLREFGHTVATAGGGEEALERLAEEPFDLVFTDLVMPEMDGRELVEQIKSRWPGQDVVVVTGVGDVKTAVEAMKLGAADYLLKPLDPTSLRRVLDGVLGQRRIRQEHGQLVAENLEYLSVFGQYERMLGLFSTLGLETLADRIVEAFCLEANAHGGVLWLERPGDPGRLRLAGAGGLVRVEDEEPEIVAQRLPDALAALAEPGAGALLVREDKVASNDATSLYVPLRTGQPLLGILRMTDKLDGSAFDAGDCERADRLAGYAAQAVSNALAFRSLERRSFRDGTTGAYTHAYFEDVVSNEIRKAQRFGRTFSVVRMELDDMGRLRENLSAPEWSALLQGIANELASGLRSTDVLAIESDARFCALLPESEGLGAIIAKRRLRTALERSPAIAALDPAVRPVVLGATATYPSDGMELETLRTRLDDRIIEDQASVVRALELDALPFRGVVDTLLSEAPAGRRETAEQMTRFLLGEIGRRAHERGLLFVAPGASLLGPLRDGLDELGDHQIRSEIVLVADRRADLQPGVPVTWVAPVRLGVESPFLVYYGEGPAYALLRENGRDDPTVPLFHTSDPVIVEHLAFRLSRELGIAISE